MTDLAAPSMGSLRVNRRLACCIIALGRKTHGWFGLWGALLGLVMGRQRRLADHRSTLKLERRR